MSGLHCLHISQQHRDRCHYAACLKRCRASSVWISGVYRRSSCGNTSAVDMIMPQCGILAHHNADVWGPAEAKATKYHDHHRVFRRQPQDPVYSRSACSSLGPFSLPSFDAWSDYSSKRRDTDTADDEAYRVRRWCGRHRRAGCSEADLLQCRMPYNHVGGTPGGRFQAFTPQAPQNCAEQDIEFPMK